MTKKLFYFRWCSFTEKVRGEDIKRPFNKYKFDGNLQELLQLLFDSLHNISKHLFHFKWQAFQYEQLKNTLEEGEVCAVIDFRQNINQKKRSTI